jgi:hypothetical protein
LNSIFSEQLMYPFLNQRQKVLTPVHTLEKGMYDNDLQNPDSFINIVFGSSGIVVSEITMVPIIIQELMDIF